jgi:hypothetical protein
MGADSEIGRVSGIPYTSHVLTQTTRALGASRRTASRRLTALEVLSDSV